MKTAGMIEREKSILVFEYPLRQRVPMLLVLGWLAVFALISFASTGLSLVQLILGQALLGGAGADDPGTLIVSIIIPTLMVAGGVLVNLMFPAIHVTPEGFRISRLLYTSRWLTWREIHDIKSHWLSSRFRRVTALTVDGISPLYGLIGAFELLGSRGFLVVDRIEDYTELMEIFQNHRPDLFE